MKKIKNISIFFTAFLLMFFSMNILYAQEFNYLEDEGSNLWHENTFLDSNGENIDTEAGDYVGESEYKALQDAAQNAQIPTLDLVTALNKEKTALPDNIVYGLGTGLMIGGWFALLQGKNARQNTRYLGIGVVFGVLLGVAVGTKSVYLPRINAPAPISSLSPAFNQDPFASSVYSNSKNNQAHKPAFSLANIGLKLKF